jgi:nicotinamidase-related amidase
MRTALIAIDMLNDFMDGCSGNRRENIARDSTSTTLRVCASRE